MKYIIILLLSFNILLGSSVSGYETRFTKEQVLKDVAAKDMTKYQNDNLAIITNAALIEKGIINSLDQLVDNVEVAQAGDFLSAADCSFVGSLWTATVYDINIKGGRITCMVAPLGNLNNPVGKFDVSYPNAKKYFSKDLEAAIEQNEHHIAAAKDRFKVISDQKNEIKASIQGGSNFLTIPELVLATILTDIDIIDLSATRDTGKIQLKDNLSSKVFESDGTYTNNSDYVLNSLQSIFTNYSKLSDIGMEYLVLFISFLMLYGVGGKLISKYRNKQEESLTYLIGIVVGAALFIPTFTSDQLNNPTDHEQWNTKYQSFERSGYNLMSEWASDSASAIIDTEVDSIISKSGIGTSEQIINSSAGVAQYFKLKQEYSLQNNHCSSSYNTNEMYLTSDKSSYKYSNNSSTVFPTTEDWGYAMALYNSSDYYYRDLPKTTAYSQKTLDNYVALDDEIKQGKSIGNFYYPDMSLAACGKSYFSGININSKYDDYFKSFAEATVSDENEDEKILMIKELVKFQYTLERDWGFLAILGLPITKMQTEMIGGLYKNNSQIIDKLKDKIVTDDSNELLHSVISSVPYMFVPGAGTVYNQTLSTIRDIKGGYASTATGLLGGLFGANMAIGVAANTAGFAMSYIIAKTILSSLPIIGIIAIGLLRFIVIIIKVFAFHFASLFMLPMMFLSNNIETFSKFTVKIVATMFEFPIFVLAVYLSIVANDLLQNISTLFTKTIIAGMIDNSNAQHTTNTFSWENITSMNFQITDTLKIYFIDGLFEVIISLFSVFIIYKIIVTLHSAIFELFELKGTETLDNMVDSIKSETNNWGNRI